MKKNLLFDMDGVLTDSESIYLPCWIEAFHDSGIDISKEKALELRSLGNPFRDRWFSELTGCDPSLLLQIVDRRNVIMSKYIEKNGIKEKDGVSDTLKLLSSDGWKLYITTSVKREQAVGRLEQVGIREFFSGIMSANELRAGKPAPDIYQFACKTLGVNCSDTFAVEDSPNGVISASDAGCRTIMIPDLTPPDEDLINRAEVVLTSMRELPGYLGCL